MAIRRGMIFCCAAGRNLTQTAERFERDGNIVRVVHHTQTCKCARKHSDVRSAYLYLLSLFLSLSLILYKDIDIRMEERGEHFVSVFFHLTHCVFRTFPTFAIVKIRQRLVLTKSCDENCAVHTSNRFTISLIFFLRRTMI